MNHTFCWTSLTVSKLSKQKKSVKWNKKHLWIPLKGSNGKENESSLSIITSICWKTVSKEKHCIASVFAHLLKSLFTPLCHISHLYFFSSACIKNRWPHLFWVWNRLFISVCVTSLHLVNASVHFHYAPSAIFLTHTLWHGSEKYGSVQHPASTDKLSKGDNLHCKKKNPRAHPAACCPLD